MKIKVFTGILCVFLLGISIGGVGMHIYTNYQFQQYVKAPVDFIISKFIGKLKSKLDLSNEQEKQVQKQFYLLKDEFLTFRKKYRPEFVKIKNARIEEMKKCLKPAQREKLDKLIDNLKKKWISKRLSESGENKGGKP